MKRVRESSIEEIESVLEVALNVVIRVAQMAQKEEMK